MPLDLALAGKTALVTGASRGIGLAVARALAGEGVTVVAASRKTSPGLTALPGVRSIEVDLAEPGAPARLLAATDGRLDILVNNVGAAVPRVDGFLATTDEQWAQALELNLLVAVRMTRAALPLLLEAAPSAIINTGSVNAELPDPIVIDYSAAKAALVSFAKSISKEFGPRGVRVNTVAPGPVATDLWLGDDGVAARMSAATGTAAPEVAAQAASQMVTGRFTRPDEVADLVLLLASPRTANMTGGTVRIDGGLITTT